MAARLVTLVFAVGLVGFADLVNAQQPAVSSPLSPQLQKFADECDTLRRGTIHKLEESLRGLRSGQVRAKNKDAAIREAESDIAALRKREQLPVPAIRFPPMVGNIGRLPGAGGYVEQILGSQEMLVTCTFRVSVVVTKNYRKEPEVVRQSHAFKIRGVSTKHLTESNDVELLQVFRISGNETYRTADGRKATIQVLVPVDMRPIEAYVRAKPE